LRRGRGRGDPRKRIRRGERRTRERREESKRRGEKGQEKKKRRERRRGKKHFWVLKQTDNHKLRVLGFRCGRGPAGGWLVGLGTRAKEKRGKAREEGAALM